MVSSFDCGKKRVPLETAKGYFLMQHEKSSHGKRRSDILEAEDAIAEEELVTIVKLIRIVVCSRINIISLLFYRFYYRSL